MVVSTAAQCNFAIVQQVTIESIDDKNVVFTTRGSGPAGSADQNLRKTFTVSVADVYTLPIDGAPAPVAMVPGATGNLYLSRSGWQATTHDGFKIFGCTQAIFKFPHCAGITTPVITRLAVVPASVVVRGHLPGESVFFDIELAGPDAGEAQDIVWNGVDYIALHLTARGARRMGLGAQARTVQLWPTKIRIKGSPVVDRTLVGEVDILNNEKAACTQHIAFAKHGAPVTLRLTQDGVNAFHVTPQAILDGLSSAGHASPAGRPGLSEHGTVHHVPVVGRRRSPE
jgi:hypothetical protein